jgi:hypothetical protein
MEDSDMNGSGKSADRRPTRFTVNVAVYSPMRKCEGCKQRRSITQFVGESEKCKRCVRRSPI